MASALWSRPPVRALAGLTAVAVVTVGGAPAARADDAALATWLTKAFDPIQQIHVAENALIPLVAPMVADPDDEHESPLEDVNLLKAPCEALRDANANLQGVASAPDPDLSAEIQQAVDSIDTSVANCARTIADNDTDREKARKGIQGALSDAEAHLASADIILAELAKPK